MRLLYWNDQGGVTLRNFPYELGIPKYAILSHVWLAAHEEVKFDDVSSGRDLDDIKGYRKIRFCGQRAALDGLQFFWVDTCCINKSDNAELQTAINSMFRWYAEATKCYVYLPDVSTTEQTGQEAPNFHDWEEQFRKSRWFTRGWTLQELLAPRVVEFFTPQGIRLGDKVSLEQVIHEITGIARSALQGEPMENFNIVTRRSWIEKRQCTIAEDRAYCLLGIFGVFMTFIYGESEHAFDRLLDEIHKKTSRGRAEFDRILETIPTCNSAAFNSLENQHSSTCLEGTRIELLQEIADWATNSNKQFIYVLTGTAGTGKSTIARTVARLSQDQNILGASFFFSKGGGDACRASMLFTTIASQLASKIQPARRHICNAIANNKDILKASFRDQWEQLIMTPLLKLDLEPPEDRPSTIVVVIDALDECDDEREINTILRLFATGGALTNIKLRFLITSRPQATIRAGLRQIPQADRLHFVLQDIPTSQIIRDLWLFFKSSLAGIGEERDLPTDWPGARAIRRLVEIASGLFIWASTACLYIGKKRRFAEKRMNALISRHGSVGDPQEHLDQLYTSVLKEAIDTSYDDEEREEVYATLREILGTVAILSSPLSVDSLGLLLNIQPDLVVETLADLHAIVAVPGPDERHRPIRLHHPSFRDFLLDRSRCTDSNFWIDEQVAHQKLAESCVQLMSKRLRHNICGLDSAGTVLSDIRSSQLQYCLPAELQYACLNWAHHNRQGKAQLCDGDTTHLFFEAHFLHWLEAMSLLGKGSETSAILRTYQSLINPTTNTEHQAFVGYARKFVVNFHSNVEPANSPLQVYCSALVFTSSTNYIRNHFWALVLTYLRHVSVVSANTPDAKDEYNYVCDVVFTPDGKLLASGSQEEWVRVWDVSLMAWSHRIVGHTDKVSAVSISRDGLTLASGADDFMVKVVDLGNNTTRHTLNGHTRWVNTVALSPDNMLLASGSSDETVKIWDVYSGKEIAMLEPHLSSVNSVAFSPDGLTLAVATSGHLVQMWDLAKCESRHDLDGHSGPVHCVQYSPNGKQLASGSDDTTVIIWEAHSGSKLSVLKGHESKVWAVAFSHNSVKVVSGSEDRTIKIWDSISLTLIFTLRGHDSGVNSVTFSPDDKLIASGSFNDKVRLWDVSEQSSLGILPESPEEGHVSGIVQSMALLTPSSKLKAHTDAITSLAFSTDGQTVASGSSDSTIKVWSNKGAELGQLAGHTKAVNHLVFSPVGQVLASASFDHTVKLWRYNAVAEPKSLEDHHGTVHTMRFSGNGRLLASCSDDGAVRLWDVDSGLAQGVCRGHSHIVNDLCFSPDSRTLASCSSDLAICIWDTSTAEMVSKIPDSHDGSVVSITFAAQGNLLLSSSADGTVKVWRTVDLSCQAVWHYNVPITSAAFSLDAQRVVSSLEDGSVKIWTIADSSQETVATLDVALRNVSFSSCGHLIDTDRGSLATSSFSPARADAESKDASTVFVSKNWLRNESSNILWLSHGYHITSVATWRNMAVLGQQSGALVFIAV